MSLSIDFTYGGAIIVSRKANDGTWMRSNATIKVDTTSGHSGSSMQNALDLLVQSGIEGLSELYLNNAGTSTLPGTTTKSKEEDDHGQTEGPSAEG